MVDALYEVTFGLVYFATDYLKVYCDVETADDIPI